MYTGNLHFVKFETSKIEQCLEFIQSKNLHHSPGSGQGTKPHMRVQATGGGAFKYADMFQVLLVDFNMRALELLLPSFSLHQFWLHCGNYTICMHWCVLWAQLPSVYQ